MYVLHKLIRFLVSSPGFIRQVRSHGTWLVKFYTITTRRWYFYFLPHTSTPSFRKFLPFFFFAFGSY